MTSPETIPDGGRPEIEAAVIAWHQGDGTAVADLPDDDKREALRRLGYDTRQHLELFGL